MPLITVTINNRLEVGPVDRMPHGVLNRIRGRLTFENPAYLSAMSSDPQAWTELMERVKAAPAGTP